MGLLSGKVQKRLFTFKDCDLEYVEVILTYLYEGFILPNSDNNIRWQSDLVANQARGVAQEMNRLFNLLQYSDEWQKKSLQICYVIIFKT